MDRGAWQSTVLEVPRVQHDLVTNPPPLPHVSQRYIEPKDRIKYKGRISSGRGIVMNKKQDTEPNGIPQYAESNETPITEHEAKPEDDRRPKREISRPQYLKDYAT